MSDNVNKYIANAVYGIFFVVYFYALTSIFRDSSFIYLANYLKYLPPTLLLARADSFYKKALISLITGILLAGSLFFMGNPSGGDGMEVIIPMFFVPAYFTVLAMACFVCGLVSSTIPKFQIREKNQKRIRNFIGEWTIVLLIIILGGLLVKQEYLTFHLSMKNEISVPKYEVSKISKTEDIYVVFFENNYGCRFDHMPTNKEIENVYKKRTDLYLYKDPLNEQYVCYRFFSLYKNIGRVEIHSGDIGRLIFALGYPTYILIMCIFYFISSWKRSGTSC